MTLIYNYIILPLSSLLQMLRSIYFDTQVVI